MKRQTIREGTSTEVCIILEFEHDGDNSKILITRGLDWRNDCQNSEAVTWLAHKYVVSLVQGKIAGN